MTKVSAVFSIIAITAAVLLFAAGPVMATTTPTDVNSPTIVVNPCPVNTVWLGGNTCQLVNGYGYGGGFGHGYFSHH
jgi:hypothetical protein